MESEDSTIFKSEENAVSLEKYMEYDIATNVEASFTNDGQTESTEQFSGWSEVCRVCATSNDHIIPIFEGEGAEHLLSEKIHKYLPIRVSETDTLPIQLCYHCAATILAWHELLEGCLNAEKQLLKMQDEQNYKENDNLEPKDIKIFPPVGKELAVDPISIMAEKPESSLMDPQEEEANVDCNLAKETTFRRSPEQLHEETESVREDEILIYEDNVKNVFCEKCNFRFFHISELVEHMRSIHDDQVHHCQHCDLVYRGSDEIFLQHVRNHESGTEMGDNNGDDTSNADETSFEDYSSVNNDNEMLESSTFRNNPSETQEERRVIERASASGAQGVSYKCQICECLISSSRLQFLRHIRAHREYGHYRCDLCDEYFLVPFLLNEHKNEFHPSIDNSKNIKYHPEAVIKDSQTISNARSYMCEFCGMTYPSITNLRAHQQIAHAHLKLYMCDFCERNYTTESALANHHRSHIREQGHYTCEYCDKKFRTSNSLHLHRRIHENQKPHICTKCEKRFAAKEDLRDHIANHEKNRTFVCETCGKNFVLKRNLLKHVHVHNNDETFVCKFCPSIKFRQKRYLRVHTQIHHPDELHDYIPSDTQSVDRTDFSSKKEEKTEPIDRINVEYPEEALKVVKSEGSKDNLGILRARKRRRVKSDKGKNLQKISHLANESEVPVIPETQTQTEDVPEVAKSKRKKRLSDGPYICDFCGKQFRLRDSFTSHLRIHMGEKQFTCHICGKQFIQAGCLYYHLRHFHGGVKNHTCDICGHSFAMKTTMEDHRRSRHTGERPYICDTCGKTFASKSSLYIHRKIHTESYPHECNYCKKSFRWKQQLIGHLTIHTGEKKYACDFCGKAFGVKHHLTRHKRTHDTEKLYTCNKCGTSFGQKRYLASHERSKHK